MSTGIKGKIAKDLDVIERDWPLIKAALDAIYEQEIHPGTHGPFDKETTAWNEVYRHIFQRVKTFSDQNDNNLTLLAKWVGPLAKEGTSSASVPYSMYCTIAWHIREMSEWVIKTKEELDGLLVGRKVGEGEDVRELVTDDFALFWSDLLNCVERWDNQMEDINVRFQKPVYDKKGG